MTDHVFDGAQIEQHAKSSPDAIFTLTESPGVMSGDHFHRSCTLPMRENLDKAMHLALEREIGGEFPADCFECAAEIADRKSGDAADEPVGNF